MERRAVYPILPVAKGYAWGSYTRLQHMFSGQGIDAAIPPIGEPLAEMWFSGHSGFPSLVTIAEPDSTQPGRSPNVSTSSPSALTIALPKLIGQSPEHMLGARCSAKFGPTLPYLLKVISARIPLSLQVHPVDFEARRGYNAQNAAGVAFGSPERSFSDPVANSEMVMALEPFQASIGFAPVVAMLANLTLVNHPVARRMVRELTPRLRNSSDAARGDQAIDDAYPDTAAHPVVEADAMMPPSAQFWPDSRRRIFRAFYAAVSADSTEGKGLVDALHRAASQVGEKKAALAFEHAILASETFSEDPSSLALLMMNPVALSEGEAVFIPAGTLHAYIRGTAAEIMTNSDNVLRAGLTEKHKDIPDFLRTLDCRPASPIDPSVNLPEAFSGDRVVYRPRISEFMLTYGHVGAGQSQWPLISRLSDRYGRLVTGARHFQRHCGPRIVLCTQGAVRCVTTSESRVLPQGSAMFVPDCEGWLDVRDVASQSHAHAGLSGVRLTGSTGWEGAHGDRSDAYEGLHEDGSSRFVEGSYVLASTQV